MVKENVLISQEMVKKGRLSNPISSLEKDPWGWITKGLETTRECQIITNTLSLLSKFFMKMVYFLETKANNYPCSFPNRDNKCGKEKYLKEELIAPLGHIKPATLTQKS